MDKYSVICHKCKSTVAHIEAGIKISRQAECTHCHASLKCCVMCQFFDPSAYNECHEHIAERIVEKEKANFCDYFLLSNGPSNLGKSRGDLANDADALFKK